MPVFTHDREKSDVMSLGLTMIAICLLKTYSDLNDVEKSIAAQKKVWDEMEIIGYSDDLIEMLSWMLKFDENDRPNINQIYEKIKRLEVAKVWKTQKISIVKPQSAPRSNSTSRAEIDLEYLSETVENFFPNCRNVFFTVYTSSEEGLSISEHDFQNPLTKSDHI